MIDKYQQMEDFKQLEVETVNLPCKKCNGDCCGPDVHFSKDEIVELKKIVSLKKFKVLPIENSNSETYMISSKGVRNTKCVFLKNNKCSIYNARPKICKDYGEKIYIQCPYNGLKEIPDSLEERTKLTIKVQDVFYNKVSEILGVRLNLTPHTAKNALAKYKE